MPPAPRLSHRRRSSFAITGSHPVRPGIYGIASQSPRPVTFAPNVTPVSYSEPDQPSRPSTPEPSDIESQLFPPSENISSGPTRKRVPPHKRLSQGYIPRPPNAFMLFRANFVRQEHIPGRFDNNHGSLSKVIGNCWRSLPLEQKRVWEIKAKQEKAAHKEAYPEYRFRPVHKKNKPKKKGKAAITAEDERRCEEVAQLLLEGKKGEELAAAIRELDEKMRAPTAAPPMFAAPMPIRANRRSSSVPLPDARYGPIALPSISFFADARSVSPVGNISRSARSTWGQRRASSAQAIGSQSWGSMTPAPYLQRDDSSLPEVDASLFEPSFLDSNFSFSVPQNEPHYNYNDLFTSLPPNAHSPTDFNISPLDNITSNNFSLDVTSHGCDPNVPNYMHTSPPAWLSSEFANSQPSSSYSGSPARSDLSLPLLAPHARHAGVSSDMWKDMASVLTAPANDFFPEGLDLDAMTSHHRSGCGEVDHAAAHLANYPMNLDGIFDSSFNGIDMDHNTAASFGFSYSAMTHEL
ncbi:hypothetical protein BJ138DRAFT_1093844 [Hygrophoropsis aurantiaca]|uniref:Uncharacterized protein n=1 Tax=Hygrophoropsis aurantiaca TaxID=72124 RepID=A0ACB8A026_9AGAM|nr:hypothetical protein BJ138DRAFT_1093844 [Hygrophoropsis aurantiaca]